MSETNQSRGKVSGAKLFIMGTASIVGPWLLLTSQWIGYTGASVALAFLVCGLLCIPIALCYGELSGMFKDKGGTFEYVKAAFGRETGYWVSWTTMFSYILATLFVTICATMLLQYLGGWEFTQIVVLAIAIVLMLLLFVLNTRDMSTTTSLQSALFVVLVIVGIVMISMFFINENFDVDNWQPFFQLGILGENTITGSESGFFMAVAALVTMFFGFELIPQFAVEASYPRNKQWKLMVGAIVFVIIFDSLICLAEMGMNSLDPTMSTFEYISSLYGSNGMVSAIFAEAYVGDWLKWIIGIANFCCILCVMIGFWMGSAGTLFSMGKSGALPALFTKTNKHGMPKVANAFVLLMVFILTLIAVSGESWMNAIFSLMALGVGFTYLGVSLSYLKLRRTMPDADRPWTAPGKRVTGWIAVVASLFMVIMMFYTMIMSAINGDPTMVLMTVVFFAIIGVIRVVLKKDEKKHPDRYFHETPEDGDVS